MNVNTFSRKNISRGFLAVGAASALMLTGLTACGSDSTVDNSQEAAESAIPSVSSAPDDQKGEDSGDSKDDSKDDSDSESSQDHAAPPAPAPDAEDSGAEEVEEVPSGANRSPEDEDYLNSLKDKGLDVSAVEGASQPGGLEDQLIAAGQSYCSNKANGQPGIFAALAAGQLQAQGISDRDPKELEGFIVEAADSAFCK